jgi:Tfp pilus assembly protein PilX
MIRRLSDETGSALITAFMATILMLGLGFALLSIVDTQASESAKERSRDRAFNLSESVLTSEAFVLGRNWPTSAAAGACKTVGGFGETVGTTAATTGDVARVRRNVNANYDATVDPAYTGATWQVHLCDDVAGSTVWDDSLLNNNAADTNANNRLWVHAQSTVEGRTRAVAGLVKTAATPALDARYGLVSGGLVDDLGSTLNTITNAAVLQDTLHNTGLSGLLDTSPTVAADPTAGAATPNGVTGVRCGALDIKTGSLCVTGTLAGASGVPLVDSLVTGGRLENFPTTSSTSDDTIARLRAQARASGTYTALSAGSAPVTAPAPLVNANDTVPASVAACTITGAPSTSTVVFIEQVGNTGAPNAVGGPGDQYCSIDVSTLKQWKAIVVGSGRVVIRGNNSPTLASNTAVNTFKGVVYALNLQRLTITGGDATSPGREVVRIDRGAHIRGAVHADGKSARVGVYPPATTLDMNQLRTDVCNALPLLQKVLCITLGTVGDIVNSLGIGVLSSVVNATLSQLNPQRALYGSAITSDVATINALTVTGDSNVMPGSFRDLQVR